MAFVGWLAAVAVVGLGVYTIVRVFRSRARAASDADTLFGRDSSEGG
jgi:hypothetical protein